MSPPPPLREHNNNSNLDVDEALCEILGLTSFDGVTDADDDVAVVAQNEYGVPKCTSLQDMATEMQQYKSESVCILPQSMSVSAVVMRRLTDELVFAGKDAVDKTYETIRVLKHGQIEERRTLTRLENFVNHHEGWRELCHVYLKKIISTLCGRKMVLFKEKLNLKPPGGSGFAPHVDTPSLRVALGEAGPQTFVTVMVAIDNVTTGNGCLRIAKGTWSDHSHVPLVPPLDDNPDAGGREGAVPLETAEHLDFEDITCRGGVIVAFNGWAPHRSSANTSPFPRRAVFLTYNPASEGDFHDRYYERMKELRNEWRDHVGLGGRRQLTQDERFELEALSTVPK